MISVRLMTKFFGLISLLVYLTLLSFIKISYSHDTGASKEGTITAGSPVHQKISKEAGNVWRELPDEIRSYLQDPISANVHKLCEARYEAGFDIVSASADEDQEWWISCNSPFGPYFAPRYSNGFFEHFWDPDEPNFGGSSAYDKGLSDVSEPLGIFIGMQFASSYNKAQEFWNKKVICYYTGRDNKGNTCPVDKPQAYYWLGRIAHLLEDVAVPAHVHNVQHDPYADLPLVGLGGKDPFEDHVAEEFFTRPTLFRGENYQALGPYKYEGLPGISLQEDFKWEDLHPNPTNLFKLFWYTAQKTQYYASGGTILARVGDQGGYKRLDGTAAQFRPSLWEIEGVTPVGIPADVPLKLPQMAEALIPHALRAVAGLYHLFWFETQSLSPPGAATLISPIGSITTTTPTYTWNAINATWYYLWVDAWDGQSWRNVFNQWYEAPAICSGTTCSVPSPVTLLPGDHFWWLQGWNPNGYGPWTGTGFTVSSNKPSAVTLISPSGLTYTRTPTYTWNAVNATWYYLWADAWDTVSWSWYQIIGQWYEASSVCSGATCSVTYPITLDAGAYDWWIQPWNPSGYGEWAGKRFTVGTSPFLDQQAIRDMNNRAAKDARFGASIPESFGLDPEWDSLWELRWMDFNFTAGRIVQMYHATNKSTPSLRYTLFWDPDTNSWNGWTKVE